MFKVASRLLPFAFVITAISACSSSSSSSVSVDQACADYASAICTKASSCSSLFIQVSYGDAAACTARFKASCVSSFAANGTSLTTARAEACVTALGSATCDAIYDRNTPSDCRSVAGKLANGTACGDDNQCTSAFCNKGSNAVCGTCGTGRGKAGDMCKVDENCDYGLKCATNGTCVARVDAGGACDLAGNQPCKSTLFCNGATMTATGTCATPAAEGAMCVSGSGLGGCNVLGGDYCNPVTKVCQKLPIAAAGAACGYDAMAGTFTVCGTDGFCKLGAAPSTTGTCVGAAVDGAMCDTTNGPKCTEGAQCVNGVCQKPDPSSCK